MSTKVKICGLTRLEDVQYVNEVLPEYAGFVFWDKSKRNLLFEQARTLRNEMDQRIQTVGVFVDADPETIAYLMLEHIISVVQLHGNESEDYIRHIRSIMGPGEIIKAFEVRSIEDIKRANESSADIVLIDSGKGSGNTFDWNLLKELRRDFFLAGGLSAENVSEAISQYNPYAVDISSKVETDGLKDREKIIQFCKAVRG